MALLGSGSRGRKSSEGRGAGPSKLLSGARELPAGLTSSCSRETDLLTLESLDPSDLASKHGHDDKAAVKAELGNCQQAWQAPAAKLCGFFGACSGDLAQQVQQSKSMHWSREKHHAVSVLHASQAEVQLACSRCDSMAA